MGPGSASPSGITEREKAAKERQLQRHPKVGVIHKDADVDYGVSFPDFPGCITAGMSRDETRNLAAEALAFHVAGMIADGEAIPEPSTLESVMADMDKCDGAAILVPLETQLKTVQGRSQI